jgi:glycosyltransferase involved in cell wall biosynthesis
MFSSPLVSVLLPVYNGAEYLDKAIRSILEQTYANLEIIAIDDGSIDESSSILEKYVNSRVRVFRQDNQGLAATLNRAIGLAQGDYLARQDQDDISFPERLEKQVDFLQAHPDYGMVGTWAEIWRGNKPTRRAHRHPTESLVLKFELLFDNPFVHSSVMLRKEAIEKVGVYSTDPARQPPEDYELWSRMFRQFNVANIPEILQIYRAVPTSMSRKGSSPFNKQLVNLSAENLAWISGRPITDPAATDLAALTHRAFHRLSPNPSFDEGARLLLDAAEQLSAVASVGPELLRQRAWDLLDPLRPLYAWKKSGLAFSKIIRRLKKSRKGAKDRN